MHPVSCTNTAHDVIDLVNHGMLKNTKSRISSKQNGTLLQKKKDVSQKKSFSRTTYKFQNLSKQYGLVFFISFYLFCVYDFLLITSILLLLQYYVNSRWFMFTF